MIVADVCDYWSNTRVFMDGVFTVVRYTIQCPAAYMDLSCQSGWSVSTLIGSQTLLQ